MRTSFISTSCLITVIAVGCTLQQEAAILIPQTAKLEQKWALDEFAQFVAKNEALLEKAAAEAKKLGGANGLLAPVFLFGRQELLDMQAIAKPGDEVRNYVDFSSGKVAYYLCLVREGQIVKVYQKAPLQNRPNP
jgi:hypothetical protein